MTTTANAWVALGGNLGDVRSAFEEAVSLLSSAGEQIVGRSSIYLTPPLGPPQPDYFNAAVALRTARSPQELLSALRHIEDGFGRQRTQRWGPRTLDLDLLFFGDQGERVAQAADLTLPHPEIERRAFVLIPMAELAPDLRHPLLDRSIQELLAALPEAERQTVRRLDIGWPAR